VCRAQGLNRSAWECLYDKDEIRIRLGGGYTVAADSELLMALLPERENPLQDLNRFETASGRRLCFIPLCTSPLLDEVLSAEVDAREYGIETGSLPRWKLEAFRVARTERALVDEERMRPKDNG